MSSRLICAFMLINASLLYCCQEPCKQDNLDPARLMLDTAGNNCCYKKIDGQCQYDRNQRKKRVQKNPLLTLAGAAAINPNVTGQKNLKYLLKKCATNQDYDSDDSYCESPELHGQ